MAWNLASKEVSVRGSHPRSFGPHDAVLAIVGSRGHFVETPHTPGIGKPRAHSGGLPPACL
jgi:hypothetical protein